MALEFYKRRFRVPSKKMQYVLAITALLLACALVISWMVIRHKAEEARENSSSTNDASSVVSAPAYTDEDAGYLLLIIHNEDTARFILVHSDPANNKINVSTIDENSVSENDLSLTPLYHKFGAPKVAELLAKTENIPLRHYAAVSDSAAQRWFARFEGGITVMVDSAITIPAQKEEQPLEFEAGEQIVNATEATTLLTRADDFTAARVITGMLKQYLHEVRYLPTDFSYLANIAQTSLRIGDFTDYHDRLSYLAAQNTLGNCTISAYTSQIHPSKTRR